MDPLALFGIAALGYVLLSQNTSSTASLSAQQNASTSLIGGLLKKLLNAPPKSSSGGAPSGSGPGASQLGQTQLGGFSLNDLFNLTSLANNPVSVDSTIQTTDTVEYQTIPDYVTPARDYVPPAPDTSAIDTSANDPYAGPTNDPYFLG